MEALTDFLFIFVDGTIIAVQEVHVHVVTVPRKKEFQTESSGTKSTYFSVVECEKSSSSNSPKMHIKVILLSKKNEENESSFKESTYQIEYSRICTPFFGIRVNVLKMTLRHFFLHRLLEHVHFYQSGRIIV